MTTTEAAGITTPEKRAQPHVVMMVANDVTVDTRVRKMAHDIAQAGPRVTVLGLSSSGNREVALLGRARIVRVPSTHTVRTVARSKLFPERSTNYELTNRIRAEQEQFMIHQREVGAAIGWLHRDYERQRRVRRDRANEREAHRLDRLKERNQRLKGRIESAANWKSRWLRRIYTRLGWLLLRLDRRIGESVKRMRGIRYERAEGSALAKLQKTEKSMREKLSTEHEGSEKKVAALRAELTKTADDDTSIVVGRVDWRTEILELHDYDAAFSPELDSLDADVVHAHDVHLLGVAARGVGRAIVSGRNPTLIYDAHEYVQGLSRYSKRTLAAWASLEREYVGHADAIITVSEPLADLLESDYGLGRRPAVILNTPVDGRGGTEDIRQAAGVNAETPLVVYSGGLDPTRGIHTLVEAVGKLPGVHLALVSKADTNYVRSLQDMASQQGFGDRLHVVPFVQPQHVVSYLRSATAAVHPMVSGPMNHEIALPNKIFEYMHAGLPMVVSSCKAMAELTDKLGIGEVFESENAESLAEKLKFVLNNLDIYKAAYQSQPDLLKTYSWASQRTKMLDLYTSLLGPDAVDVDAPLDDLPADSSALKPGVRVAVGPMNMAGQAWEWAKAIERSAPSVETEVFEITRTGRIAFPADVRIDGASWRSLGWQLEWARHIGTSFSHILLESGFGALGNLNGGRLVDDLPFLSQRSVNVGAVFHGSEIRDPVRHRDLVEESPFDEGDQLTHRLVENTARTLEVVSEFDGPIYISTLDLLDYIPQATWLPQVIDTERWSARPFSPRGPLKVLFVPTSAQLKGGRYVKEVAGQLHEEGVIELRLETSIPRDDMPDLVANCDVLIDGLVLGLYGTTSVEGMASGRVVLANLRRVLDRQPEEPPIVHTTPKTLESILREIASNPEAFRDRAEGGPAYASKYHDGRYAARQLRRFLEQ